MNANGKGCEALKVRHLALAWLLVILCGLAGASALAQGTSEPPVAQVERALFAKGQTLYNEGLYGESIAVLSDFLNKHPKSTINDLVLLWLGRSHLGQGNIAAAEKVSLALKAIPDTALLQLYEGELAIARQNYVRTDSSPRSGKSDLDSGPLVAAAAGASPAKNPELNQTLPTASVTAISGPQALKEARAGTSQSEVVPQPVKIPAVALSAPVVPLPSAMPPVPSAPRSYGLAGGTQVEKPATSKAVPAARPVITTPAPAKEANTTRKVVGPGAPNLTGRFTEVAAVGSNGQGSYRLTIVNEGSERASELTIRLEIDSALAYVSSDLLPNRQELIGQRQVFTFKLPAVDAGQTRVIQVSLLKRSLASTKIPAQNKLSIFYKDAEGQFHHTP